MNISRFPRLGQHQLWTAFALGVFGVTELGCQMTPAVGLVSCPLPSAEQVHEILEIVPLGTPREETLERLTEAGIEGNFGENQSIFYCDVWQKSKDLRWHINVVLLFDDDGRFYATRPDAAGQIDPTPRSPKSTPLRNEVADDPFLP